MNTNTLAQFELRLHRVERHNRILLVLLCATIVGLALLGTTKGGSSVITANEVHTQRLYLINENGNIVHQWVVHGGVLVEE